MWIKDLTVKKQNHKTLEENIGLLCVKERILQLCVQEGMGMPNIHEKLLSFTKVIKEM